MENQLVSVARVMCPRSCSVSGYYSSCPLFSKIILKRKLPKDYFSRAKAIGIYSLLIKIEAEIIASLPILLNQKVLKEQWTFTFWGLKLPSTTTCASLHQAFWYEIKARMFPRYGVPHMPYYVKNSSLISCYKKFN